jgi:hypothetical protein
LCLRHYAVTPALLPAALLHVRGVRWVTPNILILKFALVLIVHDELCLSNLQQQQQQQQYWCYKMWMCVPEARHCYYQNSMESIL